MGCLESKPLGNGTAGQAPPTTEELELEELEVLFFDCDDTLYQNNWATAERLKASIERYTVEELGLSEDEAFKLYLEHGTALRGLIKHNHLSEAKIEHFLEDVHNVSLEEIHPRPELREMLLKLGHKKRWVFTASIKEHAERCLEKLGISDLFEGIIDCRSVGLKTKHDPMSFVVAMETANITDAKRCILFDDSVKNMHTAKTMGFKTCLVGLTERGTGKPIQCEYADYMVDDLLELPTVMPALFKSSTRKKSFMPRKSRTTETISVYQPQDPEFEELQKATSETAEMPEEKPEPENRIIVVLGGPGSGKGTQCARIASHFKGVEHLSAGDLLRAEMNKEGSEHGELIRSKIKEGQLVPSWITMDLIIQAMKDSSNKVFLVDGCPRDQENYETFTSMVIDSGEAKLLGVLYYECEVEDMLERILARAKATAAAGGEVRADDNVETAKKRFETFEKKTVPIVEIYREQELVYAVDAARPIEQVFEDTHAAVTVMIQGSECEHNEPSRASKRLSFRRRSSRKSN